MVCCCCCCCFSRPFRRRKERQALALFALLSPTQQIIHAIETKKISTIVQLYVDGVDGSVVDDEGNNLLHIAVRTNCVEVVKAVLLLFAYKYNLFDQKNHKGLRPIETSYSFQVRECIQLMEVNYSSALNEETEKTKSVVAQEATRTAQLPNPVLLALDGGGIRGLAMVRILMHIERKLGYRLWPLIDWAAGTSTGGVLSLTLARGKSLEECQRLYLQMKNEMFEGVPPYKDKNTKRVFMKTLSRRYMSSIRRPKLLITAARIDLAPPRLKLFRNYAPPNYHSATELLDRGSKGLGEDPSKIHIWQVARCTSAAPSYFPPYNDIYADGGIIANNPTIELLSEFAKYSERSRIKPKPACVISLGTGMPPWKSVTIYRPYYRRVMCRLSNLTREWEYYRGLYDTLVEQITESNGRPVMHCRHWCNDLGVRFFRISPQLSRELQLDEKDDRMLLTMMWDTEVYLSKCTEIEPLVAILRGIAVQRHYSRIKYTKKDAK